jgi:hypothetical protein
MSMKRCNLWDNGAQTATRGVNDSSPQGHDGDRCYTDTDVANMGQVMVKLKKFWYAMVYSAGTYCWYISSTGADSLPSGVGAWKVHPAFIRNGVTKNQIYLGAYEGFYNSTTTMLESKAGVSPVMAQSLAYYRTAAEMRAGAVQNEWEENDYLCVSAVQLLLLLEYGGFDLQTRLSAGITNLNGETHRVLPCLTGHTTSLGNASGQVGFTTSTADGLNALDTATATNAMSYRGIENFSGNVTSVLDGLNLKATNMEVFIADHNFTSCIAGNTSTGFDGATYIDTGISLPNTQGEIDTLLTTSATYDYTFFPGTCEWSLTTYIPDEWNQYSPTTNGTLVHGGMWSEGGFAGPWELYQYPCSGAGSYGNGSRVMYIG